MVKYKHIKYFQEDLAMSNKKGPKVGKSELPDLKEKLTIFDEPDNILVPDELAKLLDEEDKRRAKENKDFPKF